MGTGPIRGGYWRCRNDCKPGHQRGCGCSSQAAGVPCLQVEGWHFLPGEYSGIQRKREYSTKPNGLCPGLGLGTRKGSKLHNEGNGASIQGLSRAQLRGQFKACTWFCCALAGGPLVRLNRRPTILKELLIVVQTPIGWSQLFGDWLSYWGCLKLKDEDFKKCLYGNLEKIEAELWG